MSRRKSFQQLLIAFAMNATDDELNAALDTLKAFRDAKAPKATKPRAKRSDAGKPRTRTQTSTTAATAAAGGSSSGN